MKVIPSGVKVLAYATSVRWIGWGFAESLIPIFLFSFAGTYAATALLRSAYDIAFILALPISGMAADRFRSTSIVLFGLILYVVVGSGYLLAGVTGLALFVVLARFTNGVSYALDAIGRETYIRRHTPKEKLATIFGYIDTVCDFWWILAAIAGIWLVRYFSIPTLLFMIVPTSLIAFAIVWRFRRDGGENEVNTASSSNLKSAYGEALREFGLWEWKLRLIAAFNFFIAFSSAAVGFFLPIESYVQNGNLSEVILIGVFLTIPTLLGWAFGKWFDRKGISLFFYGFIAFGILLSLLVFSYSYEVKLLVAFGVGVVVELLSVGSNELITVHANPDHYGRVGGVMRSVFDVGSMVGPLAIGILIDWQGFQFPFLLLAVLMFMLASVFLLVKRRGMIHTPEGVDRYHHRVHQIR